LLAAIPGAIDYVDRVPPDSSAKARATTHALIATYPVGDQGAPAKSA
jgi:hypothetical protein